MSKGIYWSGEEDFKLRQLWAQAATNKELIAALPNRPLGSILTHARLLRLGRRVKPAEQSHKQLNTVMLNSDDPGIKGSECLSVGYDLLLDALRRKHTLAEATKEFLG